MRKRFARAEQTESQRFRDPPRLLSDRQREILAIAARLFRERGYHATILADIGAEAGISGPAVYRHFASKDELLHQALLLLARSNAERVRNARAEAAPDAASQLEALVGAFVANIVEERDLASVYLLETRHAPTALVEHFRSIEHAWRQEWIEVLRTVRPDLDDTTAQTLVRAVTFLAGSVAFEEPVLERDALVATLHGAAMSVLNSAVAADSLPACEEEAADDA